MRPAARLGGVLHGAGEAVFDRLPQSVLNDLRHAHSESSLIWNLIYSRAHPWIGLGDLLALTPLWGTPASDLGDDRLVPYFWGFAVAGEPLDGLDAVLEEVDGPGKPTEVDVFLRGEKVLISVECKRGAGFGRCGRYGAGRCPEVHPGDHASSPCRYWEQAPARFDRRLEIGPRPREDDGQLACDRHYQLARTDLVGSALAARLGLAHHLWVFAPRAAWPQLEPAWLDFVERVRSEADWRQMRALAWEDIERLPVR